MNWIFLGSGRFGAKILRALKTNNLMPTQVYTLPDKPQGRGRRVLPVPVKQVCMQEQIRFYEISSIEEEFVKKSQEFDFVLSADIGLILPQELVHSQLCLNIHPSLLPRWRGPAPIFWSLRIGDKETGISIFRMDEKIDSGQIVYQRSIPILETWNYQDLENALVEGAIDGVKEVFQNLRTKTLEYCPQQGQPSYARKIKKDDLRIDWSRDCEDVYNLIRAASPYLGAWAVYNGRRVKFYSSRLVPDILGESGKVVKIGEGIVIACGRGAIEALEIQPEAKRRMAAREFVSGYRVKVGTKFE